MAKTQDKSRKVKNIKTKSKKIDKKHKPKPDKHSKPESSAPDSRSYDSSPAFDSDSDSDFDLAELREILQPYSKDQLVDLLCSVAQKQSSILSVIRDTADRDITHRKIFVHGLAWEATRESLLSAFEPYGEIEDCNVVTDKVTGKTKGYGFVLFKWRKGAKEALKEPRKRILNRMASCQLASLGPVSSSKAQEQPAPVKINFEPLANQSKPQPQGQQVLSGGAVATPPPLLGQYPGLNSVYGTGLLGNPALVAGGGYVYPGLASALRHGVLSHGGLGPGIASHGLVPTSQVGGIADLGGGGSGLSVLGAYLGGQNLQNAYSKRGAGRDQEGSDLLASYSSYMWYVYRNLMRSHFVLLALALCVYELYFNNVFGIRSIGILCNS